MSKLSFTSLLLEKNLNVFQEITDLKDDMSKYVFQVAKETPLKGIELPASTEAKEYSIKEANPSTYEEKIMVEIAAKSRKLDQLVFLARLNEYWLDNEKNQGNLLSDPLLNPNCRDKNYKEYLFFKQYIKDG